MQHGDPLGQLLALARIHHHLGMSLQDFGQLSRTAGRIKQTLDRREGLLMVGP